MVKTNRKTIVFFCFFDHCLQYLILFNTGRELIKIQEQSPLLFCSAKVKVKKRSKRKHNSTEGAHKQKRKRPWLTVPVIHILVTVKCNFWWWWCKRGRAEYFIGMKRKIKSHARTLIIFLGVFVICCFDRISYSADDDFFLYFLQLVAIHLLLLLPIAPQRKVSHLPASGYYYQQQWVVSSFLLCRCRRIYQVLVCHTK